MGIFDTVLYRPIYNLFVSFYHLIPDIGVAIILLTIVIKLILYPLTAKSIVAQRAMSELEPKMRELKAKYKNKEDQQILAQETLKLYQENKVNPMGSCLPILVQLPIFIALYWVLQAGLTSSDFSKLYSFVPAPESISPVAFGFLDLGRAKGVEAIVLALLAGLAQFFQAKSMMRSRPPAGTAPASNDEAMMAMMNKQMLYLFPALTVFIGWQLPAGLSLYWGFSTVVTIFQQYLVKKKPLNKKSEHSTTEISSKDQKVIEGEIVSK